MLNPSVLKIVESLFRQNWTGQAVRNLAVYASELVPNTGQQLTYLPIRNAKLKPNDLTGSLTRFTGGSVSPNWFSRPV